MPSVNTCENVAGAMPSPHMNAFLKWVDDVIDARRRYCTFKRSTTYYIDPVSGSDAANGTTTSTPWKTLTNVRTQLAANCTNTAFLFKRGTVLLDHVGLNCTSSGNFFGAYGPNSSNGLPKISCFNVVLSTSVVTWTSQGNNRFTTSMPASGTNNPSGAVKPSWIRKVSDPLNPFTIVDSTAKVESTPYSFYIDGSNVIHLNPGSDVPGSTNYEANPYLAAPPTGINLAIGSDKCWINELSAEGWGCQSSFGGTSSGFQVSPGGEEVVYISNCESYYNGRHSFSMLGTDTTGGIYLSENNVAGYCSPLNSYTTFNSYSDKGFQETIFLNCVERFAGLPSNITGLNNVPAAGGITTGIHYGHSGTTGANVNLFIAKGSRILDERSVYSRATTSIESYSFDNTNFLAGTDSDPTTYRVFIIDAQSPRTQLDAALTFQFNVNTRICFINCRHYIRHNYANTVWWQSGAAGLWINSIFEIEPMQVAQNINFFSQNVVLTGICPRYLNCAFFIRGSANASQYIYVSGACSSGARFANCLFSAYDNFTSGGMQLRFGTSFSQGGFPSVQNDTNHLRYYATVGVLQADSGSDRGFNSGLGWLNLETANTGFELIPYGLPPSGSNLESTRSISKSTGHCISQNSPLAGKGSSNPYGDKISEGLLPAPQYDFFGRPRPSTPSIGPIDVYSPGGGGSGAVKSFVGGGFVGG